MSDAEDDIDDFLSLMRIPVSGADLRDAGAAQVDMPEEWRAACDRRIFELAATGQEFTAEDVRSVVGNPPCHPNAMGARFLAAVKSGFLEKIRYAHPARPTSHASVIAVWKGRPFNP